MRLILKDELSDALKSFFLDCILRRVNIIESGKKFLKYTNVFSLLEMIQEVENVCIF